MSRRWLTALLFVLAMTLQVIAPVANGVAAAHGLDGPLGHICFGASHADQGPQPPGHSRHNHHHHDCALCQGFCDDAPPVVSRSTGVATPAAQWTFLRWSFAHQSPNASLRHIAQQARAPPLSA
ncbi:MAG: DUF2946 family protein [Chloroflexota bacterium]